LAPQNPNEKLKTRRVRTLKNLHVAQTDEQALDILRRTDNNLGLAILMHKKNITFIAARALLTRYNNNVIEALKED
jgi:N-acetylmuramic acid 6-phosphate (MurNAc-6-P) etherase